MRRWRRAATILPSPPPVSSITVSLTHLRSRQVRFDYSIENAASGLLLATGHTEHISVDLSGHMARIPQPIMDRFAAGIERMVVTRQQLVRG